MAEVNESEMREMLRSGGVKDADDTTEAQFSKSVTINLKSNEDEDMVSREEQSEEVDYAQNPEDSVMIGVEIFEESDLDTDTDNNKLQLYSDIDAGVDSDAAIIPVVGHLVEKKASASLPGTSKISSKPKRAKINREPSRLSLEDRIKCIRMCCRYNSFADVQKAWKQKYGTEPPCRKTLSTLNKKFQKTGSVADLTRTGRPKSTRTEEVVARVEAAISKDPSKSIRTLAKELGINQASVHRIRKEFEDKRSTLKMENKKLKDSLNDAMKRVALLERRLTRSLNEEKTDLGVETLLFATPSGENAGIPSSFGVQQGSCHPTIIALNSSNGQLSLPSVLVCDVNNEVRLQQGGQETIHIITIPQGSSHHQLLSLEESPSVQLSVANENDTSMSGNSQAQSSLLPIMTTSSSQEAATVSYVLK